MNFCSCVKVHLSLFITLAKHDALSAFKIHITAVELYQFTDADASRGQKINHGKVTCIVAVVAHKLQRFIRIGFFYRFSGLDLMNPPHRTLYNIVLVFQPSEERGEDTPYVSRAAG